MSAIPTHFTGSLRFFNTAPHARPRPDTKPSHSDRSTDPTSNKGRTPRQPFTRTTSEKTHRFSAEAMPSRTRHDPPDSVSGVS